MGLLAAALVATSALAPTAGAAGPRVTETVTQLAPGLTYTKITDPSGPFLVHVLTVDPSQPVTLDPHVPTRLPVSMRTSDQAAARGAVAAVNGDFAGGLGQPAQAFAEDGKLRQTGLSMLGGSFAISRDELHEYIGPTTTTVDAIDVTKGSSFAIDRWNSDPAKAGEIAAFTKWGGALQRPPTDTCSARLLPVGKLTWTSGQMGLARDYQVESMTCRWDRSQVMNAVVLEAKRGSLTAGTIQKMAAGDVVTVTWSHGWPGVMDSIGGHPVIVNDGLNTAPNDNSYFCSRNPRTGIAYTADGKVLLVVVDGRSTRSVGMRLREFGNYLIGLGAVYAINEDGGGSSTMWIKGLGVVNHPTDSTGERPVRNTLLVLPGPDAGEPLPRGAYRSAPTPTVDAATAWRLEMTDPGSTGGLADALVNGYLGRTGPLPASYVRIARAFRTSLPR